jgi:hypothetical protein
MAWLLALIGSRTKTESGTLSYEKEQISRNHLCFGVPSRPSFLGFPADELNNQNPPKK